MCKHYVNRKNRKYIACRNAPEEDRVVALGSMHKSNEDRTYSSGDVLAVWQTYGRQRKKWLGQLRNDSTRPIGDLWRRAVDCGHVAQRRDIPRRMYGHEFEFE